MDYYKLLNKELITEVQTLKQLNRMYEKIITESKGELMRERCLRVQQQQRFLSLVKKNFGEMVKVINPNTNLNDLLSSDKENYSPRATEPRSANEILENFAHSLQAVRRSTVTLSPIPKRRTTLSKSATEDSSVYEVDSEVEENNSSKSSKDSENEAPTEVVQTQIVEEDIKEITNVAERLSLLAEESEEDEEEAEEQNDGVSTLRDNTIKRLNTLSSCSRTDDMVLRCSASTHSESIYQVSLPLSFPAPNNSHLLCSTPREFTDESTYAHLSATAHTEASTPQTSTTTRPRRKCAPRNLKERSLNQKLRNESSSKKTGKKSAKKSASR